jgi:superfamily II DNA helicase RecQ
VAKRQGRREKHSAFAYCEPEDCDFCSFAAEARTANDQLQSGELKLLYVAPERFNNERFLETVRRNKIALFAIDEAHCISEWGHNFRPDYLRLAEIAKDLRAERILALTATATPTVVENICARFRNSQTVCSRHWILPAQSGDLDHAGCRP